jgi:hypothetical protein
MATRLSKHSFFISLMAILCCLLSPYPVKADAAPPPDPSLGSTAPYQPIKTMVQMISETVLIDIPTVDASTFHVSTSFLMRNQGSNEEKMQVIFPMTNIHAPDWIEPMYKILESSFHAKVNGEEETISVITTPPEISSTDPNLLEFPEGKFRSDVYWAAFEAVFPVNEDVTLQIYYDMVGNYFTGVEYIIETGAGWYGNIQSADIRMRLPFPAVEEVIVGANRGYTLSGNDIEWKLANFEPTRKDNFQITIMNPSNWTQLEDMRKNAEQEMDNANAWYELGGQYAHTGYSHNSQECNYPSTFGYINNKIATLAVDAFGKAVDLRPEWGEAHSELAMALWAANVTRTHPPSKAIQQKIIQELELAWKGIFSPYYYADEEYTFLNCLNKANPGLDLQWPEVTKATPSITQTPTPTLTRTASLTKSPKTTLTPLPKATLAATLTPTPEKKTSEGRGWLGGVATGMILLIGAVFVLLKRDHRQKK